MSFVRIIIGFIGVLTSSSCAHSFYYLPEISGEGAIHGKKGGIVYSVPAEGKPELTVRVRALGIKSAKGVQMLGMRMSFACPPGADKSAQKIKEFLDPKEQILRLEGGREVAPAFVHSRARAGSIIDLKSCDHAFVELLYPLGEGNKGSASVSLYYFEWRVHYGAGKVEQQTIRFDRYDSAPQQAAEMYPEDPDYPYDLSPVPTPGWEIVRDPYWWGFYPWWP